jgi:ABC-2 type transport system ATP-binding protein
MLRVISLNKRFGNIQAVKDFSIRIAPGEIVGLVGPNGSGKTTAIECMLSLQNADSGQIIIGGHDLYKEPELAKALIAYIPEMPSLLTHVTVLEQIQFTAEAWRAKDYKRKADRMIEGFDLTEKRNSYTWSLSKGQGQKLGVISAFIHSPKMIFMDEPVIGIDPKGGRFLKDLIKEHVSMGGSVLISSHMLNLIEELCSRIYVLNKGSIVTEGTMEQLQTIAKTSEKSLESIFLKITEG